MREGLFEAVKQAITLREAAEQYGVKVGRNGMALCPFHSDKNPSLKLNMDYYYCFGCGATGDVIDFVARLFQISSKEAAQKLASDFGVSYNSTLKAPYTPKRKRPAITAQLAQQRENYTFRTLAQYRHLLQDWQQEFSPKSPDEVIDPRYFEAIHQKDFVEYMLDTLISGSPEEKAEICAERNPIVRKISRRLSQVQAECHPVVFER